MRPPKGTKAKCPDCKRAWDDPRGHTNACKLRPQGLKITHEDIDNPQAWHLVKCQCGHPTCNRYTVEHRNVHGAFYQGCGWGEVDARRICDILNRHWEAV